SMPFERGRLRIIAICDVVSREYQNERIFIPPSGLVESRIDFQERASNFRDYNSIEAKAHLPAQGRDVRRSSMTSFHLNGKPVQVDVDPSTPLLWVLRDSLGMTGTKFGCGMALCGACTVHLDGKAIRSCVAPVARVEGKRVTTIEGLSENLTHPLQRAWIELDVPQCGYCQSGQIMSAAVLLVENSKPTDKDIDEAMGGNICRCGTYPRIRRAIHKAAELAAEGKAK
ncbi:MAG TPA: (2Fe-2S)-binding protein, partial [Candidatus Acidoferrum sp.]